jgi:integrase
MLIDSLHSYLAIRRKLGFKLKTVEEYLRNFVSFATARGDCYIVSKTAVDWAAGGASENVRARRLSMLRRFALYLRAEDDRHEIPADKIFCSNEQRRTPYIFTDEEVVQLIMHAQRLGPPGSLRPHTFSTLGLLASTGLRVSEALSLRLEHITQDGLVIRETKFKKSRIVPLHPTVVVALNKYLEHRRKVGCSENYVFVSHDKGKRIGRANRTFRQLLATAGIKAQTNQASPRLHSLRHRFATKALESCPDSRDRVTRHMLAISTYMGHVGVKSTYWYLENTPGLMNDIAQTCQSFMQKEVT